ncbi:odorant receptor 67a-like [Culicoides brevitarsis]|uniref:odorant receptor 67a-like n=1 Tax=Culicoides brevitarsis TaxID=469753 RepID=UPI00307B9876
MTSLNIKSHVKLYIFFFQIGTLSSPQRLLRVFSTICLIFYTFFYLTSSVTGVRDLILSKGIHKIEILYEILHGLSVGLKLLLLRPHLKQLKALLHEFDELNLKNHDIILSYVQLFNKLFKGLASLWVFAGILAIISPFFVGKLPFESQQIPFLGLTEEKNWKFALTMLQQDGFLLYGITSTIIMDGYPALILALISGYLEEIANEVRKIKNLKGNDAKVRLCSCYDMYQKAVELQKKFSQLYSIALSIQAAVGTISICAIMVKLSLDSPLVNFGYYLRNVFLMLNILLEIAFVNFMGSKLIQTNLSLSNALYDTNWLEKDSNFRKLLIMFQQRAQKVLQIRIGFIFVLDLNLVGQICNLAYKLYAVLMKVNNI